MSSCDVPIRASLDQYMKCPTPGCDMHVLSIMGDRHPCGDHGGSGTWPQYRYSAYPDEPVAVTSPRPRGSSL